MTQLTTITADSSPAMFALTIEAIGAAQSQAQLNDLEAVGKTQAADEDQGSELADALAERRGILGDLGIDDLAPAKAPAVAPVAPFVPTGENKLKARAEAAAIVSGYADADLLMSEAGPRLATLAGTSLALFQAFAQMLRSRCKDLGLKISEKQSREMLGPTPQAPKAKAAVAAAASAATLPPLTQFGIAERFTNTHDDNVRYVLGEKSWMRWSGVNWTPCEEAVVQGLVKSIIDNLPGEAAGLDAEIAEAYTQRAEYLQNNAAITGTTNVLSALPALQVKAEQLNADMRYLTAGNGAVALHGADAGKVVLRKDLLLSVENPTDYDAKAQCPRFLQALNDTFEGRQEDIAYYELVMGYSMLGDPAERAMFFHIGQGTNGKSLLMSAICNAVGRHAVSVDFKLYASEPGAVVGGDANSASPAKMSLRGKRIALVEEFPKGGVLRDQAVKELAGGGNKVTARTLHQKTMAEFYVTTATHILLNGMPAVRGGQESTWNRIYPIVYTRQFEEAPNSNLPQELRGEAKGILAWLVRCTQKYLEIRAAGKRIKDYMPARALAKLDSLKLEQDPLHDWLEDCCVYDASAGVFTADAFASFKAYCEAKGDALPRNLSSSKMLSERLRDDKRLTDKGANLRIRDAEGGMVKGRGFAGLRLLSDAEREDRLHVDEAVEPNPVLDQLKADYATREKVDLPF